MSVLSFEKVKKDMNGSKAEDIDGSKAEDIDGEEVELVAEQEPSVPADPIIENNGPYWYLLTVDKEEQKTLFQYIDNCNASDQEKKAMKQSMAESVSDLINNSVNPTVAPYAKQNDTILRITARANTEEEAVELIKPVESKIREKLGINIYGEDDDTMEDVLGRLLIDKGLTISSAESCTGGLIAAKLVNYPGISAVFKEGVITYSNEAKMKRLGVKKDTLDKFSAVSYETAKEMAEGIAKTANTDIGIATTGVAGPSGGTFEKPVGLVYIGLYKNGKTYVKKCQYSGSRDVVRQRATMTALDLVRRHIINL